jgi:hypothetical protein
MTNTSRPNPASDKDTDQAGQPDTPLGIAAAPRPPGGRVSIGDLLGMPDIEDIELEIPPRRHLGRAADLS